MSKLLQIFMNRLVNINATNKSLYLPRIIQQQFYDLHQLDFLNGKSSFQFIEKLIQQDLEIPLIPVLDSRDAKSNEQSDKIKNIFANSIKIYEETGAQDLYVGWPFVYGKLGDGTFVRCPLLLFPIEIKQIKNQWALVREEANCILNPVFGLSYFQQSGKFPDELPALDVLEEIKDSTAFRTQLYTFLKENNFTLHFNQDLFQNKLDIFYSVVKDEFDEQYGQGVLKLYSHAVLGLFPQSSNSLLLDYKNLIKNYEGIETFDQLFPIKKGLDRTEREEDFYPIVASDASQDACIKIAHKGDSFVVQGPPGTGKSQLITNLISDFISRGKKVLVVSQKRAALDVVYQRLSENGLGQFSCIVHDYKKDHSEVFRKIEHQINSVDDFIKQNNQLDSIFLEREFLKYSRQIESQCELLQEVKSALFAENSLGIPLKQLYLLAKPNQPFVSLNQNFLQFNHERIKPYSNKLELLYQYGKKFDSPEYLWNKRVSFAQLYYRDIQRILQIIDDIDTYQPKLSKAVLARFGKLTYSLNFGFFIEYETILKQLKLLLTEEIFLLYQQIKNKKHDKAWLEEKKLQLAKLFQGKKIEKSILTSNLSDVLELIDEYEKSRTNFFSKIVFDTFSGKRKVVEKILHKNQLMYTDDGMQELRKRIVARQKLEKARQHFKNNRWIGTFPELNDWKYIETWITQLQQAIIVKEIFDKHPIVSVVTHTKTSEFKDVLEHLLFIETMTEDARNKQKTWQEYIHPDMMYQILNQNVDSGQLKSFLQQDFESICEYDQLLKEMELFELKTYRILFQAMTDGNATIKTLFENSLYIDWISYLEEKHPEVKMVSTLKIGHSELLLSEAMEQKGKLMHQIIPLRLRENATNSIEYNRLNNRTTYRDLLHQVSKKRQRWPVRKLLFQYYEEIFKLVPCWLTSPESVAALFPVERNIDLVIFDEASQCYPEKGIPVLCRAKQIVIAGDSKQLRPTDVYQTRVEQETDEYNDSVQESLLELSAYYLPSEKLMNHYRSKRTDLIRFSNQMFYKNTLQHLPDFGLEKSNEAAVEWHFVQGFWEKNVNEEEAIRAVQLFKQIRTKKPKDKIGVITFNLQQALLIEKLLLEEREDITYGPYFIKNIENVQGDECDIGIISIGYGYNKSGKFQMQFGSLSQENGENRLNVAVTRCKNKMIVLSSIRPGDLKTEDLSNKGAHYLKKFLEYCSHIQNVPFEQDEQNDEINVLSLKQRILNDSIFQGKFKNNTLLLGELMYKGSDKDNVLIQTDDRRYHQYKDAKAFHYYNPLLAINKGWVLKNLWSRNYCFNPQSVSRMEHQNTP